jgi:hypothetical protein
MVVAGVATGTIAYAAFGTPTSNSGNQFGAGTVTLSDNDSGSAMFNLTNQKAGFTSAGCIQVTYNGSVSANVHLYATVGGTGLGSYLSVLIYRGTNTGGFNSCATFAADSTNYIGLGAGIIKYSTLTSLGTSYATGQVDPTSASPATWATGESHWYEFLLQVPSNSSAEGLNATITFTWEAQNT